MPVGVAHPATWRRLILGGFLDDLAGRSNALDISKAQESFKRSRKTQNIKAHLIVNQQRCSLSIGVFGTAAGFCLRY
jgi:hypothetical protein